MTKRLQGRVAIGLALVAVLLWGVQWLREVRQDPDFGTTDTRGWIVAIRDTGSGAQTVVIKPSGELISRPSFSEGCHDRSVTWRPDGARLFFVAEERGSAPHIYRWNPSSSLVEKRTFNTRPKSALSFEHSDIHHALIASGACVLEFSPKNGSCQQILPPLSRVDSSSAVERGVLLLNEYQKLGTSFVKASWVENKRWVVATMACEEGGNALILQEIGGLEGLEPPKLIALGDQIEFDVSPDGKVVYSVQGCRSSCRHVLCYFRPREWKRLGDEIVVFHSDRDDRCLGQPKISPSGSRILAVVGNYGKQEGFRSEGLLCLPVQSYGISEAMRVVNGKVSDPAWDPDSEQILYVKEEGSARPVYKNSVSRLKEVLVTKDRGCYSEPQFSSQISSK